jgi:predicted nucleic acid-binding protein
MAAESLFLDTSLIVAATVDVHPSYEIAAAYIDAQVAAETLMCISPQVCREFLVVLTRQPVSGRTYTLAEALAALHVWMTGAAMLDETEAVLQELLRLIRRYEVLGKQVHDGNLVATMKAHGVSRLATRNPVHFRRFEPEIRVEAVVG